MGGRLLAGFHQELGERQRVTICHFLFFPVTDSSMMFRYAAASDHKSTTFLLFLSFEFLVLVAVLH